MTRLHARIKTISRATSKPAFPVGSVPTGTELNVKMIPPGMLRAEMMITLLMVKATTGTAKAARGTVKMMAEIATTTMISTSKRQIYIYTLFCRTASLPRSRFPSG